MSEFHYNGQDKGRAARLFAAFLKANPQASSVLGRGGLDWIMNKEGHRSGDELLRQWDEAVGSTKTYRYNLNVFDHEHGFLVPNAPRRWRHRLVVAQPGGGMEQWNSVEFKELLSRFGLAAKYGGVERSWYGDTTHLIVVGKPEAVAQIDVTHEV